MKAFASQPHRPVRSGSAGQVDELVARSDGRFHLRNPDRGLFSDPNGVYNFVRVQGETQRSSSLLVSIRSGHAALAGGRPVLYAGTIALDGGKLNWWSNYSGTYQPVAEFRSQAQLPNDHFVPWQRLQMGGVGLQRGMLKDQRPTARPESEKRPESPVPAAAPVKASDKAPAESASVQRVKAPPPPPLRLRWQR